MIFKNIFERKFHKSATFLINTENLKSAITSKEPGKQMVSKHFDTDYYITCYQSTWSIV